MNSRSPFCPFHLINPYRLGLDWATFLSPLEDESIYKIEPPNTKPTPPQVKEGSGEPLKICVDTIVEVRRYIIGTSDDITADEVAFNHVWICRGEGNAL